MKKIKVVFENSAGKMRTIGYCGDNVENVSGLKHTYLMIRRFLTNYPHFKIYYVGITGPRYNEDTQEKCWWYDVGSHTEFFHAIETNEEWVPHGEENTYENYATELFELAYPDKADEILKDIS